MRKKPAKPSPPGEPDDGGIFTVAELAKRWKVHRNTIEDAIREGRLQAFKPNQRGYRVRESEVLRYEQQSAAVAS